MAREKIEGGVVHEVPDDMAKILRSSKAVLAAWRDRTPLARNEWICWVVSVKKPETRNAHILRVREELLKGKRRPCCWAGCSHR